MVTRGVTAESEGYLSVGERCILPSSGQISFGPVGKRLAEQVRRGKADFCVWALPVGPDADWDSHGTAWSPSHQGRLEKSLEHLRKQMEDATLFQAQAEETCALWQAGAGSGVKAGA